MNHIIQYISFIKEAEGLKSVLRTAFSSTGKQESTAEHTWRLSLLALLVLNQYPSLDKETVLGMCLVHDLGELYEGDIPAVMPGDPLKKFETEKAALLKLCALLPPEEGKTIYRWWEEYSLGQTKAARLVKALDKAETIMQHNQGRNPEPFDYEFNLQYGREYFEEDDLLLELRELLDEDTNRKIHG